MSDKFNDVDRRIIDKIPTELWQLILSYLAVLDILPHVPRCCKFLQDEVVWGKWSGTLLWREMGSAIDARERFLHDHYKPTALIRACDRGAPLAHIETLLIGGANIHADSGGGNGKTALYWACRVGHESAVRKLLEANADPNTSSFEGELTSLMTASFHGHLKVVQMLIEYGADIGPDEDGNTALMLASHENCADVVCVLLNARANVNLRNRRGESALDIARHNSDILILLEGAQNTNA